MAPLADAIAAGGVDGAVSLLHWRAREWLGVGVAENSADGKRDETFAVAAVHPEFAFVQVGGETAPIPRDPDVHVAKNSVERRRERGVIRAGLIGVFETECRADGGIVVWIDLDLPNERSETGLDSRDDRRWCGRKARWLQCAGGRHVAAIAQERLPPVPLLAVAGEQFLDGQSVIEIVAVAACAAI